MQNLRIGIIAGEASGDLLGAKLIQDLRKQVPNLQAEGVGGAAMLATGFNSLIDMERLAVMGFLEPLLHLPDLILARRTLQKHFITNPPDIFIGIDSPGFNLGLEARLRKAGIPIIHYVSPSIWAWRKNRIFKIAKAVDMMLTLMPFEAKIYQEHHIPVRYVGHPLAQQIPIQPDTVAARRSLCIDENAEYIAILPGSRKQELKYLAEPFLRAAQIILKKKPHVKFITSHINAERYQEFYEISKAIAPDLPLHFFTRRSQDVMQAADIVLVTSGTATLETMLYKKPMVIAYKMSKLTFQIAKRLVKTPFIGLPNLLANQLLVPELIQDAVQPEAIANYILAFMDDPEKTQQLKKKFTELHEALHSNSCTSISQAVFDLYRRSRTNL